MPVAVDGKEFGLYPNVTQTAAMVEWLPSGARAGTSGWLSDPSKYNLQFSGNFYNFWASLGRAAGAGAKT